MATTYITSEEMKSQLIEALAPYGISYQRFLQMKIDDTPNYDVRDMWLMTHNIMVAHEKALGNIVMRAEDFDSHYKHDCVRSYASVSLISPTECCDVSKESRNQGFRRLLDTEWFQGIARAKYDSYIR